MADTTGVSDLAERARNRLVRLHGHFTTPVRIETLEEIGTDYFHVRIRTAGGEPGETDLTRSELDEALATLPTGAQAVAPEQLFRWVEAHRIRLAFAHDPHFAVSLSGVRGLPHQIEAVYRRMLPQPRLRFVLADDPGAGKTIMTGLLMKELKLRGVVDRTLVIAPAPLTLQWQDELYNRFDETFEVVSAPHVRGQLGGNPWQRHHQVIASLDFAKRSEVLPDLLRADWDLIVIDEAHKCSAVSDGEDVRRTRRYVLAEELSRRAARLLLLTATPHSGSEDRFARFLALLDPDQFGTPELARRQIALDNSPYWLRRMKEELKDERNRPLFVRREALTQPFGLSDPELALYHAVTAYINRFLGASTNGRGGSAVALARTVLQRRLASSLGAIRSSLFKRANRLEERILELEGMPVERRTRRLRELRLLDAADDETGTQDADEPTEDAAATDVAVAERVDDLRREVAELRRLVAQADAIDPGQERKLAALHECLDRTELAELRQKSGRLLIFTEHRDTLEHLAGHLREWGYTVCTIHGGHSPSERRRIQQEFHRDRQICVATEAAGEGINLQFCHLMINYDLPWNPVRLEQRMGRVHRIGQESVVRVFNFCATNTIEGPLLATLMAKLESMRVGLQGRVYDVIGPLLEANGLDFERLVRETLANPERRDLSLVRIRALSPEKLKQYEEDVGVAQATRSVDVSWVRRRDWESEERRLMPEYVERFFLDAAGAVGQRVERRADGLYRAEHVVLALRTDDLPSVRRLGPPAAKYAKVTFRKEDRERADHEDAALLSPGHPLFGAVSDALLRDLEANAVPGGAAPFVDPAARTPYLVHLLTAEVVAEGETGRPEPAYGELVAVIDDGEGALSLGPPDLLHDLTLAPDRRVEAPPADRVREVTNWVRTTVQARSTAEQRAERLGQAELRTAYLEEAMAVQRAHLERRWREAEERLFRGEERYRLLRDETLRRIEELKRRHQAKLELFGRLGVVRPGPVAYLGTAVVLPPDAPDDAGVRAMRRPDPAVERAAMDHVMAYETANGRQPEDVSERRDGSGFDIRSIERDPATGEERVRRIEVKGRSAPTGDVGLYRTEWFAAQRFRSGFWLYVVYNAATGGERLVRVQDPWGRLRGVEEIVQVTGYRVPGASIEEAGE